MKVLSLADPLQDQSMPIVQAGVNQGCTLGSGCQLRWRDLLARHHALVRAELSRFRGREIRTAGDGFFAAFDGPARAIRCAIAVQEAMQASLRLNVRAGIHTGECVAQDDNLTGIAVHIGARIAALASGNEVLVSSTVKDLVAGAGIVFAERGIHVLRGVPGEWHVFAASV